MTKKKARSGRRVDILNHNPTGKGLAFLCALNPKLTDWVETEGVVLVSRLSTT